MVLIDPPESGLRRARRYTVHVQPSLFGGVDVVCEWGRIDTMRRPRRLVTHRRGIEGSVSGYAGAMNRPAASPIA